MIKKKKKVKETKEKEKRKKEKNKREDGYISYGEDALSKQIGSERAMEKN